MLRPVFMRLEEHRQDFLGLRTLSSATARRLQKLMDVLSEGVLLYDPKGRLLFTNGKIRELAGVGDEDEGNGADEAVLQQVTELLAAGSNVPALVEEIVQGGDARSGREVTIRVGDQERRFFATPHVIRSRRDPSIQGLLLLLTDVDALQEVRRNAQCRVALDHVQLAAELMAHRVRNPLNSIVLVLELVRRKLAGQPEQDKNLDTIQAEVQRLEARVQRFLEMVRRREGKTEVVDLVSVVETVAELLYGLARDARVTIRQQLQVSAAPVRGDEVDVLRAVLGPSAAAVRESAAGSEVKFRLDSDGRDHLLLVECAGLGPGSIGLTVAEELTTRSGGSLTYDDPDRPSRLTYRFPAHEDAAPTPR
jgi:signal transduction histidine kinase